MIQTLNATKARSKWSEFIDSVIRDKPQIIKRSRDYIFTSNMEMLKELLRAYTFNATTFIEDDETVTASLNEIDIIVNGNNKEEAFNLLADELLEYSNEYYDELHYWFLSNNRKSHLPYILNVLLQDDKEGVKNLIKCQAGEN